MNFLVMPFLLFLVVTLALIMCIFITVKLQRIFCCLVKNVKILQQYASSYQCSNIYTLVMIYLTSTYKSHNIFYYFNNFNK